MGPALSSLVIDLTFALPRRFGAHFKAIRTPGEGEDRSPNQRLEDWQLVCVLGKWSGAFEGCASRSPGGLLVDWSANKECF